MRVVIPPRHQHPSAMLRYTTRYLILLTVPLVRTLRYIQTPHKDFPWIYGGWLDLIAILLLLIIPDVYWQGHTYALTKSAFHIRRGIQLERNRIIPRRAITTLIIERPFFLRPLRAARITVDTDAGGKQRAELTLTVDEKSAKEILAQRQAYARKKLHRFRPKWFHVAALSLLASDSLSGVLLLTTALYQSGRLLGEQYRKTIIGNLEAAATYIRIIPRTIALLTLIILCGWGIAALRNLFRHLPFCVTRHRRVVAIRAGTLTRRDYLCTVDAINFVDYRQTLLSKLFRSYIVFIHCIGYGKTRETLSLLIPASPISHSENTVQCLLPEFRRLPIALTPAPCSLFRYMRYPLLMILFLYPAAHIISLLIPWWSEVLINLAILMYIPLLWWLTVSIVDRYTAGIAKQGNCITVAYARRLTFHVVVIPQSKIVVSRFRQSPSQRRKHTGDLFLYTYSEKQKVHRIRNLPYDGLTALADKNTRKV